MDSDINELNEELSELEEKLNEKYQTLGKEVLDLVMREDREIEMLVDRIIDIKRNIALRKNIKGGKEDE
ncbi:MAG: hypothetical protein Q4D13_02245 [Erysipelotrichaceae bacterium]|nr:hypothetical protein [Erysipelotrichaceae bacterium]